MPAYWREMRGWERCQLRNLEANAQPELHFSCRIRLLTCQHSKRCRARKIQRWIQHLHVVEDVGEHYLKFCVHTLRDMDILANTEIHVPVRQTSHHDKAARVRIQSENGIAELGDDPRRIRKHVDVAAGSNTIGSLDAVMT